VLLADRSRAIIGSMDLTTGSFDKRREFTIRLKEHDVLSRLVRIVHDDWETTHPLDPTDRGLLSDLETHPKQRGLARAGSVLTNRAA
jgi:hypothetical protein